MDVTEAGKKRSTVGTHSFTLVHVNFLTPAPVTSTQWGQYKTSTDNRYAEILDQHEHVLNSAGWIQTSEFCGNGEKNGCGTIRLHSIKKNRTF